MAEQLIYEISGKRYVLIELPILASNENQMKAIAEKFEMVYQGIKEINRGGFFGNSVVVERFFLPEENFNEFEKEKF